MTMPHLPDSRIIGLNLFLTLASVISIGFSGCATMTTYSPLAVLERKLVFQPIRYPDGNWSQAASPIEDVWFTSADGTQLHGWYLRQDRPRAVALFCHGNAGNISYLSDSLMLLAHRHGLSVMTFDYRGYGRSEGTPSEAGILADARAARRWLAQREAIAETDVVLMGQSLGGAVSVDLAARDGARGLVLASTFTSLPDVAGHHFPWIPAKLCMTMRLNSLEKISRYGGPLLMTHGDADDVIPYEHGKALFAAATYPKQFITVPGGKHNDPQAEEYRQALDVFIEHLPSPGTSQPQLAAVNVSVME